MVIALPDSMGSQYTAGSTMQALATRYGVSVTTIQARLKAESVPIRRPGPSGAPARVARLAPEVVELPEGWHEGAPDYPSEAAVLEMMKLYKAGHGLTRIARKFNVALAVVEREVSARTRLRGRNIPAPPTVVDEYRAGTNLTALGTKYAVAPNTVKKWLLDAGIVLRDPRRPAPPTALDEYRAGASVHSLAAKYQVSPHTARRWMVAAGLLAPLQQGARW